MRFQRMSGSPSKTKSLPRSKRKWWRKEVWWLLIRYPEFSHPHPFTPFLNPLTVDTFFMFFFSRSNLRAWVIFSEWCFTASQSLRRKTWTSSYQKSTDLERTSMLMTCEKRTLAVILLSYAFSFDPKTDSFSKFDKLISKFIVSTRL